MTRWSLKEACLLELFGELPPSVREKLFEKIEQNPGLRHEYEALRRGLTVLQGLPPHEPSAEDRQRIPTHIKKAIRAALRERQRQEWAGRYKMLIRGAALAGVCVLALVFTFVFALPWVKAGARGWPGQIAVGNSGQSADSASPSASAQGNYGMPLAYADGHPWGNLPLDDYFAAQGSDSSNEATPTNARNSRDYRQDPY